MHIKTVILLGIFFSFGLRDVVNLSTTFFIQRFFTFFILFIKKRFFNVFYSWGQRFVHLCIKDVFSSICFNTSYSILKNTNSLECCVEKLQYLFLSTCFCLLDSVCLNLGLAFHLCVYRHCFVMCVRMHVSKYACMHVRNVYAYMYVYVCVHICICMHICMHACTCKCACLYSRMHTLMYACNPVHALLVPCLRRNRYRCTCTSEIIQRH